MLWANSTTEARVSLKDDTPIPHIDLAELAEQARASSRTELINLIERRQDQLVKELCGPKYSRRRPYRRGGSYTKRLVTFLGEITFTVKRIINRRNGGVRSPILEALDARRRRYSRGVRMRLVEFASTMSYGDARREYETATGIRVPKRTIHSFVQEIAPQLLEASRTAAEAGIVIGDSTKVRARASRQMNDVRVLTSGDGSLLSLRVNEAWPTAKADVLVSDGEAGLVNAVDAEKRQLCILHAIKHLQFTLWKEGMSPEDRHEAREAVRHVIFPLVYSARKHLEDGDGVKLRAMIEWTLGELRDVACRLRGRGYPKAAGFIERNARFMVTFAELALEGVKVPHTTNRIERLMGEVSKRCKNKWMHWSTDGLKNVLTLVLVRYTDEALYENFKNVYIHNEAFI